MNNKNSLILDEDLKNIIIDIEEFLSFFKSTLFSLDFCNCRNDTNISENRCKKHKYIRKAVSFEEAIIIYSKLKYDLKILFTTRISIIIYEKVLYMKGVIVDNHYSNNPSLSELKGMGFFKEFFDQYISERNAKEILLILKKIINLLKLKNKNFQLNFTDLLNDENDFYDVKTNFKNIFISLIKTRNSFAHDLQNKDITIQPVENLIKSLLTFYSIDIFYRLNTNEL